MPEHWRPVRQQRPSVCPRPPHLGSLSFPVAARARACGRLTAQDVIADHSARRLVAGAGSDCRCVLEPVHTVMEWFYGWAWDEGLVVTTPFSRNTTIPHGRNVPRHTQRRSLAHSREPAVRPATTCASSVWTGSSYSEMSEAPSAHLPDGVHGPRPWRGHNGTAASFAGSSAALQAGIFQVCL